VIFSIIIARKRIDKNIIDSYGEKTRKTFENPKKRKDNITKQITNMKTHKTRKPSRTDIGKGMDQEIRILIKRECEHLSCLSPLPTHEKKDFYLTDKQQLLYLVSKDFLNKMAMIVQMRKDTQGIIQLMAAHKECLNKQNGQRSRINGNAHTKGKTKIIIK
jgi:hypothetical protein